MRRRVTLLCHQTSWRRDVTARSFTFALIIGVVLLNTFVVATVVVMLQQSHAEADARAQIGTATLAQVVEQNIADDINKIDLALLTTIDEIQRQAKAGNADPQALNRYLAGMSARLPEVEGVRVTNAQGVVSFGYGAAAADNVSLADRNFFQTQRDQADAGLVYSDPLLGRISHAWVLVVTRRYTLPDPAGEDEFGGIVYADLSIDRLADLFAALKVGEHGSVTLWDRDLKIVVRYPEPEGRARTIGLQIASEDLKQLVAAGQPAGTYRTQSRINDIERQLSFRKIARYPFYVSVGEAPDDYLAAWRTEAYRLGAFAILFALITALAAGQLHRGWRRRMESARALAKERSLLRSLIDSIPDAIFVKDHDGRYTVVNETFAHNLARPQAEVLGRTMVEVLGPALAAPHEAAERAMIAERKLRIDEGTAVTPEGQALQLETTRVPFLDPGGDMLGLIGVVRDVTAHKQAEAELRHARDEAEAATKAKSSFLAMMSHEIRTPMNGVMSMAEMLDQTDLSDDQRSMSQIIRSSAAALLTIINDILDFSKIEAGKLDIEAVPFSLLEVVEGAGELVAGRADEKGIGLTVDLDPAIPDRLIGDPTRIRQILLNLMGNAVKFTEAGGVTATVNAIGEPGADGTLHLRFAIRDSGIGLSDEQRARLFQPFMQADASTARRFGGTGLGLSICQRLCTMMGGAIGVDSTLGVGSVFWFELPLTIVDPALDRPAARIADARVAAIDFTGADRAALTHLLSGAGISAVEWLAGAAMPTGAADVVLLSGAGGLAGFTRLQAVAADLARAGAKPVLVAPRSLASTLGAAERAGFFATLTLPLRRHRLWHVIAAALGRAELDRRDSKPDGPIGRWQPPPLDLAHAAQAVILVAEDNRTNQIVISRLLAQLGYAHEIAGNGLEAFVLWQEKCFGLLLTDFHMPEMDGFQLTRAVRTAETDAANGRRRPIVALTADALPGTGQQCLDAGMDGYLTKPIDSKALIETLERLLPQATALRRPAEAPAPRAAALPDIDPQILDLARLLESFGAWDAEARGFLDGFLAEVPDMVAAITTALAAADAAAARAAAHALKGAARSTGAVRLGQIASDVQDCLDGNDIETAGMLAGLLTPTHTELLQATAPLRAA
jgi:PAS domain S-box-containing protein